MQAAELQKKHHKHHNKDEAPTAPATQPTTTVYQKKRSYSVQLATLFNFTNQLPVGNTDG
jgi:hypothetical protein